jgi:hypothetical protein
MLKIAIPNTLPVPRQNSIRSENGTILPPHSVKSLNSTMSVFEEREASR